MTFSELDEIVRANRLEAWDRATFVAFFAINSNPNLKRPFQVQNPLDDRPDYVKVKLEEVDFF